jgi:FkbH-like protein
MMSDELYVNLEWLPRVPDDFNEQLQTANHEKSPGSLLRKLAGYALDINQIHRIAKAIAIAQKDNKGLRPLKPFSLGIVSNTTTSIIVPALVTTAARYGFSLMVHEAPYGQAAQVAIGEVEAFKGVAMDAILIAIDYKGLPGQGNIPSFGKDTDAVHGALDHLNIIRSQLKQRYGAPCIMQTCAHEPESFFGNFDIQVNNTPRQFINIFNSSLVSEVVGTDDFLLDVAAIAETVGLANWHDPVMYHMAKLPFAQKLVPFYAEQVCRIISAMSGKARRALILDLDNTLWGGVIGDDGLSGIELGQGNAVGEAYLAVQNTVLKLRQRGIVLAVCSKNNDTTARIPFREHPDMLLNESHIAVFRANWQDKVPNIQLIAETLNLGLESIVFFDDNPVERDRVRYELPEVAVPELPEDPAYYPRTLLAAGYFEAVYFSDEDKSRVENYQANAKRVALRETSTDLNTYLKTLQMKADLQPFGENGIKRIVQLISKTNQFNLTTYRHNESQTRDFMKNDQYFTLQVRLADAFGDNGMVSVVICKKSTEEWFIDTWLMSCRVVGRRLEEIVFYEIVKSAKLEGVKKITGVYIPTERNEIVRDHYLKLGFEALKNDTSGATTWSKSLDDIEIPDLPIDLL